MLTSHVSLHSTLARAKGHYHHNSFNWKDIPPTPRTDSLAHYALVALPAHKLSPVEYLHMLALLPVQPVGTAIVFPTSHADRMYM